MPATPMLNKLKADKWKHFAVGVVMGLALEAMLLWLLPSWIIGGSIIVFIIIAVVSYAFEVLSLIIKKGHYDIWDAIAGAVGGIAGMAIILLAR